MANQLNHPAPRCHLLELSRELRDQIYSYISADRPIHTLDDTEISLPEPEGREIEEVSEHELAEDRRVDKEITASITKTSSPTFLSQFSTAIIEDGPPWLLSAWGTWIMKGPERGLLLANQQLHDEYLDRVASRAVFVVNLQHFDWDLSRPAIPSRNPLALLKKIRRIIVEVSWKHVVGMFPDEKSAKREAQTMYEILQQGKTPVWSGSTGMLSLLSD